MYDDLDEWEYLQICMYVSFNLFLPFPSEYAIQWIYFINIKSQACVEKNVELLQYELLA